jgi:hypothetical protein
VLNFRGLLGSFVSDALLSSLLPLVRHRPKLHVCKTLVSMYPAAWLFHLRDICISPEGLSGGTLGFGFGGFRMSLTLLKSGLGLWGSH